MSVANKQVTLNLVVHASWVNEKWSEVKAGEELTTFVQNTTGIHDCVALGGPDNVQSPVQAVLVLLDNKSCSNS
jgi:hypothetical protein